MNDFKIKILISLLSGLIFSFIFILLALVLPIKDDSVLTIQQPKGKLAQIAHAMKNR